jgi:hypothetical protein
MTSTITVPAGTTELKFGVLWNGGGTGNTIYINRVALYKNDFEYNYFMADQVGSNRVVLQTDPGTQTYMATMETENQSTEVQQFQNMTSSQIIVFSAANHTPGGNEAIKMTPRSGLDRPRVLRSTQVTKSMLPFIPTTHRLLDTRKHRWPR